MIFQTSLPRLGFGSFHVAPRLLSTIVRLCFILFGRFFQHLILHRDRPVNPIR